jgi:hypothetical protein
VPHRAGVLPWLIVLALPSELLGQTTPAAAPDGQTIRVGAVIFYDYTVRLAPEEIDEEGRAITAHAFNVTRAYVNVRGTISRHVSFRITPDVARETGDGSSLQGSLTFRLKYAYAEFDLADVVAAEAFARAGLQPTLFIDSQEGVYRYRFQGTVFAERDGGLSSADFGASVRLALPDEHGDVHVGIFNGEGYNRTEPNDRKSLQARITVRPAPDASSALGGLRLTGFYLGDSAVGAAARDRAIASVAYEHARFNAGVDYLYRRDQAASIAPIIASDGWSVFVTPFFMEKGRGLEGLLRMDTFRPDRGEPGRQRRLIAGLAYWFPHPGGPATAALLLDYEQVTTRDLDRAREQRIALHGLINF